MKAKLILLLLLFCFTIACEKETEETEEIEEIEEEFIPIEHVGDITIRDYRDIDFLKYFYYVGYNSVKGNVILNLNYNALDEYLLNFLSNIVEINGNLIIANGNIESLDFVRNLKRVKNIIIDDIYSLKTYDFSNLESVEYNLWIKELDYFRGEILFPNLESVGTLHLEDNFLADFKFPALKTIGTLNLKDSETSIFSFGEIEKIEEIKLEDLMRYFSMDFLSSVDDINMVYIKNCDSIQNLNGCESLKTAGRIEIDKAHNLESIAGLKNLSSVNDLILIGTSIKNLDGLQGLNIISESLTLFGNWELTDYCAIPTKSISHFIDAGIDRFDISGNGCTQSGCWDPTFEMLMNGQCKTN